MLQKPHHQEELQSSRRRRKRRAVQFACVYIMEAHAVDEWPVSMTERDVKQHQDLKERVQAAEDFLDEFEVSENLPLFADGIDNALNEAYASWPFRFWVLTPSPPPVAPPVAPAAPPPPSSLSSQSPFSSLPPPVPPSQGAALSPSRSSEELGPNVPPRGGASGVRVALKPMPKDASYNLGELEKWLEDYCGGGHELG
jgi:hypothetical protein